MSARRRWLQFPLRTAFVVLTIGCVWLGWKVDRAQRRGRAINAVVQAGDDVVYDGYLSIREEVDVNHLYLDLKGIPVDVGVREPLDAFLGVRLSQINNIRSLHIAGLLSDAELQHLDHVDDAREIMLWRAEALTDTAIEEFRRKHPHVFVGVTKVGRVVWFAPFAERDK